METASRLQVVIPQPGCCWTSFTCAALGTASCRPATGWNGRCPIRPRRLKACGRAKNVMRLGRFDGKRLDLMDTPRFSHANMMWCVPGSTRDVGGFQRQRLAWRSRHFSWRLPELKCHLKAFYSYACYELVAQRQHFAHREPGASRPAASGATDGCQAVCLLARLEVHFLAGIEKFGLSDSDLGLPQCIRMRFFPTLFTC